MDKKDIIIYLIGVCMLILTVSLAVTTVKYDSPEEVDAKIQTISEGYEARLNIAQVDAQAQLEKAIAEMNEAVDAKDVEINAILEQVNGTLEAKNTEIANLAEIVETIEQEKAEIEAKEETEYIKDELELGQSVSTTISDRDLSVLFDGEIEFDDEDYDAEEVLELSDLVIAINEKDFADDVYAIVSEEGIKYSYVFEDTLDVSDIDDDEPLIFDFLGEEVEINNWDGDEITFFKGQYNFLKEDNSITINGNVIALQVVNDDYVFVTVSKNNKTDSKKIYEGDTKTVGDYEIWVKEVLDNEEGDDWATIVIGDEVNYEVEDGDEYEEDSIWDWSITGNSIGLVLAEDFEELDDDYEPLSEGDDICLPNDYICVRFDGVTEEDSEDYVFELDNDYAVEVNGNFLKGIEDYDRIYINASGIYDEDDELIDVSTIELDNTDLSLTVDTIAETITIDDIVFNFDLDALTVDGEDLSDKEDNYISAYGVVINDPEDNLDDNEVSLSVPEEALEASIAFVGIY